ncbi:hypothetical protein OHQ87_18350 [Micromonospora sp. NBC_00421]
MEFVLQFPGNGHRSGMVVDKRGWHPDSGAVAQMATQLDRSDRLESLFLEGALRIDRLGRVESQDDGGAGADNGQQSNQLLGLGQRQQFGAKPRL